MLALALLSTETEREREQEREREGGLYNLVSHIWSEYTHRARQPLVHVTYAN